MSVQNSLYRLKKLLSPVCLLILLMALPWSPIQATAEPAEINIHHAAPAAAGLEDCSSWDNACTLQTALGNAGSGDQVWVKAGLYKPSDTGSRSAVFQVNSGVSMYGGFAGGETTLEGRDPVANLTILSGDIDNNDTNTDGNDISESYGDIQGANSYHVVRTKGTALVDGFTITAGKSNGTPPAERGGGLYADSGAPTVRNVTFSGNLADWGGAIMIYNTGLTLEQVTFIGNYADYGGAMYISHSAPTLKDVVFYDNTASDSGGAVANYYGSPNLTNGAIIGNSARWGGGMYSYVEGHPVLVNVLFSSNTAERGGGMYNSSVESTLTNVTFSRNDATSQCCGGLSNYYSPSNLANVILWGNTSNTAGEEQIGNTSSAITITHSLIQGSGGSGIDWDAALGVDAGGNLDADPLFMDADGADDTAGTLDDNLRLMLLSPAIDAGDNAALPPGVDTDLDGMPRFEDILSAPDTGSGAPPLVDMGAYEAYLFKIFLPLAVK